MTMRENAAAVRTAADSMPPNDYETYTACIGLTD